MEFDKLEQAMCHLSKVLCEFPMGAVSLNDFKPIEEKIRITRESLLRSNARLLTLRAKYKQNMIDNKARRDEGEILDLLRGVTSDALINSKAIKLCLHSTTILSIFNNKEGDEEDRKKLYTHMSKLVTLNDRVISIQQSIEEASQMQLDLKMECQEALIGYKGFLKEQKEVRSKKLQKEHPEIVRNKIRTEKTLRRINIMKKLIRNFIATSGHMLIKEPILLKMLENHRELTDIETITKMSQDGNNEDNV